VSHKGERLSWVVWVVLPKFNSREMSFDYFSGIFLFLKIVVRAVGFNHDSIHGNPFDKLLFLPSKQSVCVETKIETKF
jgi:hypothetical protein